MAHIAYVWPPALSVGVQTRVFVCVFTSSRHTRAEIHIQDQQREILRSEVLLAEPGYSTLCFNFAPLLAVGPGLNFSITTDESRDQRTSLRRPLQVPVLSLPWECSNEVLQFFDNHVKTALATLNQQGASPSTPTPDPNQPVDTQNLTVDRVYRRLVLPLLLQMRAILLDAPYHSLVEVCARLAPTLHGCEMPRCLGLLGEVIRGNNDINEDLLAPTGLFAGPSTRPHQFLQSTHDSIGPVTTSTVRQDSVDSVYDAALSGSFAVQSPPAVAGSPPAPTAASPSAVAAGLLNLSREGTRLSSGLASVTEGSNRTTPKQGLMLTRISSGSSQADSDELTESLMLTSFVPAQHEHAQQDPLELLVDPDHPPSLAPSTATSVVGGAPSVVGGIVGAHHGRRPSSVFTLHSAGNSSGSSMHRSHDPEVSVGGLGASGPYYWTSLAEATTTAARHARGDRAASLNMSTRRSMPSQGSADPHTTKDSHSSDGRTALNSGGSVPSLGDDAAPGTRGSSGGGRGGGAAAAGGIGRPPPRRGASAPAVASPASSGDAFAAVTPQQLSQQDSYSLKSSTRSSQFSSSSRDSVLLGQLPASFMEELQCTWRGFKDPVLEGQFRLHWAFSCWLVDAIALGVTAAVFSTHIPVTMDFAMLICVLGLPLLVAPFLLLAAQGPVPAAYREHVTVMARLASAIAIIAAAHGWLGIDARGLQAATVSVFRRVALLHYKNISRPVLLGSSLLPLITEVVIVSFMPHTTQSVPHAARLGEVLLTLATTLVVTHAVDMGARRAFCSMCRLHASAHRRRTHT